VAPDFGWRPALRGVAAQARLGRARAGGDGSPVQLHAWVSHQPLSVSQYEIRDRTSCGESAGAAPASCAAPPLHRRASSEGLATRFHHQTLPEVADEVMAGGRARVGGDAGRIGATAYAADVRWRPRGIALDFGESARLPPGGAYGAVGFDGGWRAGAIELAAEAARSFDRAPGGGGGLAAIVRAVAAAPGGTVVATARWYGDRFANPHARPVSAADEVDGVRARSEAGARADYAGRAGAAFALRGGADLWSASGGPPQLIARGGADVTVSGWRWGVGVRLRHPDVRALRPRCDATAAGSCPARSLRVAARIAADLGRATVAAQYAHTLADDATLAAGRRHDATASARAAVTATPRFSIRAAASIRLEGVGAERELERSAHAALGVTFGRARAERVELRYELRAWLDRRPATMAREPSPEHWLWLTVVDAF
jgi:hypothetical protein